MDKQMPEIIMDKVPVGCRVQSWTLEDVFKNMVFLKPGPQHGEIIEDLQGSNVEPFDTFAFRCRLEIVNDFAFARCRAGVKNQEWEASW
jgi:hypothetical protein